MKLNKIGKNYKKFENAITDLRILKNLNRCA
jgi:hypothetical protein